MMGTINLIKREPLTPTQQKYLDITESSTNTLASLINDILDLSKIEAGKLEFETVSFALTELIESIVGSQAVRAQQKGLEFVVDTSGIQHDDVIGDPNRLTQIFNNLLSNAVKFTDSGHIVVKARTHAPSKGLTILSCNVMDSGIGISEDYRERIFQAFSQASSSIASDYGGTGLGLSICRELCSLMGGRIDFRPSGLGGSDFYFSIRLAADTKSIERQQFVACALAETIAAVMIDDDIVRETTEKLLVSMGAKLWNETGALAGGQRVLDELTPERLPQLIVIDRNHALLGNLVGQLDRLAIDSEQTVRTLVLKTLFESEPRQLAACMQIVDKPLKHSSLFMQKDSPEVPNSVFAGLPSQLERMALENASSAKGGRIMIVDDSSINLEVAHGILMPLELDVMFATNGRIALEVLKKAAHTDPVECILMDCQMPEMDGYEATRRIRRGEAGESHRDTPIIAMTASAMSGERERCLSVGMSDYITKPIDVAAITDKLLNWLVVHRKQSRSDKYPGTSTTKSKSSTGSYELPVLDYSDLSTRMMHNQALIDRVCQVFLQTSEARMEQLAHDVQKGDDRGIRHASHTLKGEAAQIGGARLVYWLQALESESSEAESPRLDSLFRAVRNEYAELAEQLSKLYPG
ncbi:hybrid sensor histidine kinase/response regulator [Marinobacter fonticola]|uniref:hybrid sensor histidine kinase/response regulator n=1 Tax=Marinobacter fonticola TaxID=2603215 RepID=UPI0022287939|nr:hybrid sensor histidine kinase/response regulator [Marinobacter fonticola]